MRENKRIVLKYCIGDINHRIKSYEKEDFNKKVSDFRAFIFSIGSSIDIIRNTVFEDYKKEDNQHPRNKYFRDIFNNNNKIFDGFKNYLKENYIEQNKTEKIIEIIKNLGEIILNKKYYFSAKKSYNRPILKGEFENIKKFSIWNLYNSLKHSCYPEKSYTLAYFSDDILGYKGEMVIYFNFKGEKYYYEIFGGWVAIAGAEEEIKNKENPY